MPKVTIQFKELVQDSQNYGSDEKQMVSRVFFDLTVGEKRYPGAHANVTQKVGAVAPGLLEISGPAGYTGPFDQRKFQAEVETYFRSVIGQSRSRIRDCRHRKAATVSFEVP